MVRLNSLRRVIALAVECGTFVSQINVETTYLNGELEEEVSVYENSGVGRRSFGNYNKK